MIESSSPISASAPTSLVADSEFFFHPPHQSFSVAPPAASAKSSVESFAIPSNYFRFKPIIEKLMTAVLMLVAIPILLVVAVVVLVLDGRPIFYRQVRVGKNGKTFRILKFRTMRQGAEQHTGAVWSSPNDARVTRLGRWLRCSHLDELPQVINVLAGEMSLVGPRPERPEFVETLALEVPAYMQRTLVRPGITGLAQLRLGYDESIVGIPQKVACDLQYIRSSSFLQDLILLSATLPHIAGQIHFKLSTKPQHSSQHRPLIRSAQQPERSVDSVRNIA